MWHECCQWGRLNEKTTVRRGKNGRTGVNYIVNRVGGVEWIDLAKGRNMCPALVSMVMTHWVPLNCRKFLQWLRMC